LFIVAAARRTGEKQCGPTIAHRAPLIMITEGGFAQGLCELAPPAPRGKMMISAKSEKV